MVKKDVTGRWERGEAIGQGGQGNVYKTKDNGGAVRAIKIVKVKASDKKKISRIKREIEIISKLKDQPNIVHIYDENSQLLDGGSEEAQQIYYVMDFARYGSLKDNDFYKGDIELTLILFREVLVGIAAAHKANVIHRDIKPENILLYPTQRSISVADFGLGRLTAALEDDDVTESDEILGPRYFMAPEQFKNPSQANERSDIYSLGKVLYFMLTGKGKVFREEIGSLAEEFAGSNPYLPLIQEKLLDKMVVKDPEKRFKQVDEIIEELDAILELVAARSKRMVVKNKERESFYEIVTGERRQEFIDNFSKDIPLNMAVVSWVVEELVEGQKKVHLESFKNELLNTNSTGKARAAIEATFLYIEKPEELKKMEKSRYSFSSYYLAKYFEDADSHEEAHKHILSALSKEKELSLSVHHLLLFSKICSHCKCEQPHDFEQRLLLLLEASTNSETKARLFKMLSDHYKENDDKPQSLRFLEAYLAIKPYDNEARFDCAFGYSEIGQQQLAIHHYTLHKKTSKKPNSNVENNLGVIYDDITARAKSLAAYKAAFSEGNTLAGSNIASKYLSVGMIDEAREILRKIISEHPDGDYDPRVDRVLGSISQTEDSEAEDEKNLLKDGREINHINNESIKALSVALLGWIGFWDLDEGLIIEIRKVSEGIKAFTRGKDAQQLEIAFQGNSASINSLELRHSTYNFGVLYLRDDQTIEGYVLKDGKDFAPITAKRIKDIDTWDRNRMDGFMRLMNNTK